LARWRTAPASLAEVPFDDRMTSTSIRRTRSRRKDCNRRPSSTEPETLTTTAPSFRHSRIPSATDRPSTSAEGRMTEAATSSTATDAATAHPVDASVR